MDPELKMTLDRLREAGLAKDMTAEQAAKKTFEVLRKLAEDVGQRGSEVLIRAPGEPRHFTDTTCWVVAWEAGPHEWAITASLADIYPRLVEPYYSFDLTFYPAEWEGLAR